MDLNWIFNKLIAKRKKERFFTKDFLQDEKFLIGDYTYGNPTVLFKNSGANLKIGKFCSIADEVVIFLGGNHRLDWISTYPFNKISLFSPEANTIVGHPATHGDVIIQNDVWIGRGVTILSGINIENGAVIAAGSVVTKNVGAYEVWAGNPARFIKKRFDDKTIEILQTIRWWDWELSEIKKNVAFLCSDDIKFMLKNYAEKNK